MFKLVGLLAFLLVARCSEITKWNGLLLQQFIATKLNPPMASRQLAMLHTAQFEAANTVGSIYQAYLVDSGITAGAYANAQAASAQAARDILTFFYAVNQSSWDAALAASLSSYSGDTLTDSVALGQAAAAAIIANRTGDGSATASTGYTAPDPLEDGDWRPTPAAFAAYLLPNWRLVKTFGVTDPASRAASVEPPALDSLTYANELAEVKEIGGTTSTTRTSTQSLIARVWAAGGGTVTPPGQWFQILTQVSAARGLTFIEEARIFALTGIAVADAGIVCWATKYNSQRWRPITAIQLGGEPSWTSYIGTPPFPAHTSGHSMFSAAAAEVIRRVTSKNKQAAFTVTVAGESRTHTYLTTAADEAAASRVYGGIHYESDSADGLELGKSIGKKVAKKILRKIGDDEDEDDENDY